LVRTLSSQGSKDVWLYGLHAVRAALANPKRTVRRAVLTKRAAEVIGRNLLANIRYELVGAEGVSRLLPPAAVHQGAALLCDPLPNRDLREVVAAAGGQRILVVLDQIFDPQNVGAIMRVAAAFGVSAVIAQERHAPSESGALAKAASGALDIVPFVAVVNIARSLEVLGGLGFWRIALEIGGGVTLKEAVVDRDCALVLGSEGSGIRRLVRSRCDVAATVPMSLMMESLNVSSAAAIALYEIRRGLHS